MEQDFKSLYLGSQDLTSKAAATSSSLSKESEMAEFDKEMLLTLPSKGIQNTATIVLVLFLLGLPRGL